jgi:transposase
MQAGYSVIILNPLETHEQKRRSVRKIKTDSIDACRIAKVYYLGQHVPYHLVDPAIGELRNLCRHYSKLSELYTQVQLKFQGILDLVFPGITTVFSRLTGDTALKFIAQFPTPEDILRTPKEEVLKFLNPRFQRKSWPEDTYVKLLAAARECLPYEVAQQSNVRVLREYVTLLITHKQSVTDVRAQIASAAKFLRPYQLLLTIPGVGETTAAIILSEIEDFNLFPTVKQLVAYAGLDPSIYQSGTYKSVHNKISKRGSNYLRKALYQAACMAVRKNKNGTNNPLLYEYYMGKVDEGKPKMVALIATANKLLRIIYGMLRKNEPFIVG